MRPAVSVIIPAYNAAATLATAIESALSQTYPPAEIIVVDDGSIDETSDVASRYSASVRLLRKSNGGPASARNFGARAATSAWLAMLDADDSWLPEKLERQIAYDISPRIGLIHCLIDVPHRGPVPDRVVFETLWASNCVVNSTTMIRRTVFEELGGFDEDPQLISAEDHNLWLRIAAAGWEIATCQERLCRYHPTGQSLSRQFQRFMAAQVVNVQKIGGTLNLPDDMVRARISRIYENAGIGFINMRDLDLARRTLRKALADGSSVTRWFWYSVTFVPRPILDLRRRYANTRFRRGDVQSSRFAAVLSNPSGIAPDGAAAPHGSGVPTDRRHGEQDAVSAFLPRPGAMVELGAAEGPYLLVIVDAEEEFDWNAISTTAMSVTTIRQQHRAQRIFERHGLVPTYAVDYPVASQDGGYGPLREFLQSGCCEIGAQLHPWVTPPIEERICARNSFPGNLARDLEFRKLSRLTEEIRARFGVEPKLYRAGRYGIGANTAGALAQLHYEIDCSVLPHSDLRSIGGPDYREFMVSKPYWFGPKRLLLELPVTTGMLGVLSAQERLLYPMISSRTGRVLRLPGVSARLGLLDRIRLTPEGSSLDEAKRLTRALVTAGDRVLVLTYHSPSLEPGHTPYVRTRADLDRFLSWIEEYLDFFFDEMKGRASTPVAIRRRALELRGGESRIQ